MRHIGFLTLASIETDPRPGRFRAGLRELGYVEDQTIAIEWRSAQGNAARLADLAQDLLRLKIELIVAAQTQAIQAAQRATSSVPIVFLATHDPVGSGFAKSLARPGGNLTGLSNNVADIAEKQLEMLALAVPHGKRVAVLLNPTNAGTALLRSAIEHSARRIDRQILPFEARSRDEIPRALVGAKRQHADALIVQADGAFFQSRTAIAELALENTLPTLFTQPEHAAAGGLLSYGPNVGEHYHRAAYYVDRILKGTRPSDLPIEQPTTFEMVLNLKTAKALRLTFPQSLLLRADRLIE
jgi:putative ABC transport system substrate-binding protein